MSDSYRLVFRFRIGESLSLSLGPEPTSLLAGPLNATIRKSRLGHEIRVEGLSSESEAEAWTARIFTGLTALMLDLKTPIVAEWDVRPATVLARNSGSVGGLPISADAIVNADAPYLAKSNHRVVTAEGLPATLTMTVDPNRVVALLGRGMAVAKAQELFSNDRLRTAVELHPQAYQEHSPEAVLLLRAMVFEVLAPPTQKHEFALRLIERWQSELVARIAELDAGSDEYHALESLQRELVVRREASIRSRLRSFVLRVLESRSDVKTIASKVVKAYDRRSTLVHEGRIEHRLAATSADDLRQAAEQVLEMLLFGTPQEAASNVRRT